MKLHALALALVLAVALVPGVSAQSYTLSGQVVDQDGQPVQGASVFFYQYGEDGGYAVECDPDGTCKEYQEDPASSYHEAQATTDAEGRFSLPARDGWGDLQVRKEGHAQHYQGIEVSGDQELSVELLRYPDKTARIEGRVTGDGQALSSISISAENPEYGIYACSISPGDGDARAMETSASSAEGGQDGATEPAADSLIAPYPYPGEGCDITIEADGRYHGNITPGYTILRFHHNEWRDDSGARFYAKSLVRDLPADATTRLDVDLEARPAPSAIIEGYVLDAASREPLAGVHVGFSSLDGYGWASARTDDDGSYRIRVLSGMTQVHVSADGHFPWEGDVQALRDATVRYDIHLTAGESRYGGCCYAYDDFALAEGASSDGGGTADGDAEESAAGGARAGASQDDALYEDLGGGLGQYDASSAPQSGDGETEEPGQVDVPGFEILAVALGLLAVALIRRR